MTCCFVALGSNLDHPLLQVQQAVNALAQLPNTSLNAVSHWYQSVAIGPGEQPDYINGVAALTTTLQPLSLLAQLQAIEYQQLRRRLYHWGPRTLDLDILLYGNAVIDLPTLTVPHPRMLERNFVLYPLSDIDPSLTLPNGSTLKDQLKQCTMEGLSLVDMKTYPTIAGNNSPYPE